MKPHVIELYDLLKYIVWLVRFKKVKVFPNSIVCYAGMTEDNEGIAAEDPS